MGVTALVRKPLRNLRNAVHNTSNKKEQFTNRSIFAGLCLVVGTMVFGSNLARAQRETTPNMPVRPEEILAVKDVVDVQLSPDGTTAIYVVHEADLKADRFVDTIWRVST